MSIPEGAPARAWIGLGGNVGDVRRSMRQAVAGIGALPGTRVEAASSLYRTKPWGDADQDDFLNACIRISTALAPRDLLAELKRIENDLKRRKTRRWGPRTIDLDILVYEGVEGEWEGLILPHPRAAQRIFVIRPLCDIDPQLEIAGKPASAWLDALVEKGEGSEIELNEARPGWAGPLSQS
ncbi:MAG: 2-amino-4-hydroxy-6-hydroxymethyldihydropteridine diphosphokinase [Phyllobacteriaceae bacterium]|nr:2-amino-4-hydroxy-6-hydroxymethyldihydropteridine diphosphokinase [Phyllobacteriaceae bacterium]